MTEIPIHSEAEARPAAGEAVETIHMPSPTVWPLVLAFGLTLVATGLVTTLIVTIVGLGLSVLGGVGWFRDVLPVEKHEAVPVRDDVIEIRTSRPEVEQIEIAPQVTHPKLPIEIYPVRAGVLGGMIGGVAMAAVALAYGLIYHGSVWYPINLLGAVVYAHATALTPAFLVRFSFILFGVALLIHLSVCLLVGLLYGTMLPILPRRPILLGGFIAPLLWSGMVHGTLRIINPLLDQRINWTWFVASQVAFGLLAGWVVIRHHRVRLHQVTAMALRAGLEGTGIPTHAPGEDEKR